MIPSANPTTRAETKIAVVVPMANECKTAGAFLTALVKSLEPLAPFEIFTIFDDASKDGTIDIVGKLAKSEPRIHIICAPENRCVVDAYVRGYREAIASGAPWILEIDAGFSHNPMDVPKFVDAMRANYACAFASRFCVGGEIVDATFSRYAMSKGGTILTNFLIGTKLTDMTSGFQMFTKDALECILQHGIISRGPFFHTEMKIHSRDMKTIEVPISYRCTWSATRNDSVFDAFKVLFTMFGRRLRGRL